jgi:hypothetical protein
LASGGSVTGSNATKIIKKIIRKRKNLNISLTVDFFLTHPTRVLSGILPPFWNCINIYG